MSQLDIFSDYSHKHLEEIPQDVLELVNLRMLYLEGNLLKTIPDSFFAALPNLTWLDLRNNQLEDIPSTICDHKNLQTLLLQNNNLSFLPYEIGLVPTLQMLQVSGNPILYPPQEIIDGGTASICSYLKTEFERVMAVNEERMNEATREPLEKGDIKSSTSTSKASLSSTSEHQRRTPRSATLSLAMPIITVKSLSKPIEPVAKQSNENVERTHKITRQCPKFTIKSHYVNGNKVIQTEMNFRAKGKHVDENALKELWLSKLKEILADQERLIQQEKNLRSLNRWRLLKKMEPERVVSQEEFSIPPFATDEDCDRILSREDLRKQIQKHGILPNNPNHTQNIDKLMDDVLGKLKLIEAKISDTDTPRTKIHSSEEEIKAILELHKKIATLQVMNDTY